MKSKTILKTIIGLFDANKLSKDDNNGINNYTIHKIDFKAKQIGKILGITYNKEIPMDGNNDLIIAIKAAVADNRKMFTTKKKR